MDSLKVNTMCLQTFEQARAKFDPKGQFAVRDPLQREGGRMSSCITYPLPGEEVMFCGQVRTGMRVPLAPRLVELLQCYQLAPALLTPQGLLQWTSFLKVCKQLNIPYSLKVFRCLFCLQRLKVGFSGFRSRGFILSGPKAQVRGAEVSWNAMSFVDKEGSDKSTHHKERYFMYRSRVEWEVNPTDPGCPSLDDLSDEDIRCLKTLCKRQGDRGLRRIPKRSLIDCDMSTLELEPGFWHGQVRATSSCILT